MLISQKFNGRKDSFCRNPLSIQVCFNRLKFSYQRHLVVMNVVIPYQFRSVSIVSYCKNTPIGQGRNPLSIQVCFNEPAVLGISTIEEMGRNPLSIQVCFNNCSASGKSWGNQCRNPLSIQVCFNADRHSN